MYKSTDADNVNIPVTWEAQRTPSPEERLSNRGWKLPDFLPKGTGEQSASSKEEVAPVLPQPHSYQNATGSLWNVCISQQCWASALLAPAAATGRSRPEQQNNNTWFSHILLRLVGTMRRKQGKATFHFSGWKIDFRCTRNSRKIFAD